MLFGLQLPSFVFFSAAVDVDIVFES